jgi:hypothetical protein
LGGPDGGLASAPSGTGNGDGYQGEKGMSVSFAQIAPGYTCATKPGQFIPSYKRKIIEDFLGAATIRYALY